MSYFHKIKLSNELVKLINLKNVDMITLNKNKIIFSYTKVKIFGDFVLGSGNIESEPISFEVKFDSEELAKDELNLIENKIY